jgi:nucleotide-binding universal stress UspA family protein
MFTHILMPTDGSELSARAVREGMHLARSLRARVTGVCVKPNFHTAGADEAIAREALDAETALEAVAEAARAADVPYSTVIERDDSPFDGIIRVAERIHCDLILMASHGRRGVRGGLLGSETQKLLTHTKIPVLVYR